ncbi:MAG: Gx transporter family protein [Spirochaetales bacterium]|nr:Gx transporter family protein [Spirochaetales bacterium]
MKPKSTPSATDRELVALLGACCIFLALIEHMIPKPLPFLRLGLANLPILIALGVLNPRQLSAVVLLKILGQGLINGTLFSYVFLFSAAGSLSSAVVMFAVSRLPDRVVSFVGISISGGLASTVAQLGLAFLLVFGRSALYIAPVFLAVSLLTSIALGLIASSFCSRSRWYSRIAGAEGRRW